MARDPDKEYVVTAPYVTMAVMTSEGKRVVGFGPGATVPGDVTEEQFDHHLANGLIAARGEEPVQPGPTPEQTAQQARDQVAAARIQFADAQARLDNALAAKDAAEAAVADQHAKAEASTTDRDAAAERVMERARAADQPVHNRLAEGPAGDDDEAKAKPPLRGAAAKSASAKADKADADKGTATGTFVAKPDKQG